MNDTDTWLDRPPTDPAFEQVAALEQVERHLRALRDAPSPLTRGDIDAAQSALDAIATRAPAALGALKSIQIAAWVIAVATVVHLFR